MTIEIRHRTIRTEDWPAARKDNALLFFTFEEESGKTALPGFRNWAENQKLSLPDWLQSVPCQPGEVHVCRLDSEETTILLAGLGKQDAFTAPGCLDTLRLAAASAARQARKWKLPSLGLPAMALAHIARACPGDLPASHVLQETVAAAGLGLYRYTRHQATEDVQADPALEVLFDTAPAPEELNALQTAEAGIRGAWLARDLANTPANLATPMDLEESARNLTRKYGFTLQSFGPEEIRAQGMGGLMAVGQGSRNEPRFLILRAGQGDHPLALVGKGVTFDSGGISIKPSAGMDSMKTDMAGAAAVLGFFEAYGALGLDTPVVGLLPCAENMPDGGAYRPSDVVRTRSGKSVEVVNTDAEGRMLLCDALAYAGDLSPSAVVDIATLTGACVVGLGMLIAGLFGTDDELTASIRDAGRDVGEDFWHLPLPAKYADELKSDVADLRHVGRREGGAIHAAMFLKEFAPESVPWAHLDIAGPGRSEKEHGLLTKGGSGFGVRTLLELARRK
jgi:leucyl aminopeptidase